MSVNKKFISVLGCFVLLVCSSVAFASDKPVLTVGSSTLDEKEMIQMIAGTAGGNEMMVGMLLAQSTLPERVELANQMADAILFSEAAKLKGLGERSDIAFKIKWQTMQILMQAYFQQYSSKWDMSEKAVKNYYDTHLDEFIQVPASHARHILCQTEGDALNAVMEIYRTKDFEKVAAAFSGDPSNAQNGGDLGWVEKGVMAEPVDKAISGATVGSLVGPVKSEFGWHVIQVVERRTQKQLSYLEASEQAAQGLQKFYLEKDLKDIKTKIKVTIDEAALANLGGIPAPVAVQ